MHIKTENGWVKIEPREYTKAPDDGMYRGPLPSLHALMFIRSLEQATSEWKAIR